MKYAFSHTASLKVLLHAVRHPCSSICGLVLASLGDSSEEVHIVDAIPLFHTRAMLGPCFETAMVQVSSEAAERGQQIVGFYEAAAMIGEPELSPAARKIGERLLQFGPETSRVFVLDNNKFGELLRPACSDSDPHGLPFEIYTRDVDRWKRAIPAGVDTQTCRSADLRSSLQVCLDTKLQYQLWDFDDHVDDITKDWSNRTLVLPL